MSDKTLRRVGRKAHPGARVVGPVPPVPEEHLEFLPEVGPCHAVQEEVHAVVHVEHYSGQEQLGP